MFAKLTKNSKPKSILVISMTNIGDVVLTCPVIDILRQDFPEAQIDIVIGPKAVSLFEGNPHIRAKVFDKYAGFRDQFKWMSAEIWPMRYDTVVDMRHTMLPFFIWPKYATNLFKRPLNGHKKDSHLNRLREVYDFGMASPTTYSVSFTQWDEIFYKEQVLPYLEGKSYVVIAPGAADSSKRWHPKGFAQVADHISKTAKVIFVGGSGDVEIVREIRSQMNSHALSLAGEINLRQLAFLLKRSSLALTHDSGVMHLASYVNAALIALWGPTPLEKYAPWSQNWTTIIRRNEKCLRCSYPKCGAPHNCMTYIEAQDVIQAFNAHSHGR